MPAVLGPMLRRPTSLTPSVSLPPFRRLALGRFTFSALMPRLHQASAVSSFATLHSPLRLCFWTIRWADTMVPSTSRG